MAAADHTRAKAPRGAARRKATEARPRPVKGIPLPGKKGEQTKGAKSEALPNAQLEAARQSNWLRKLYEQLRTVHSTAVTVHGALVEQRADEDTEFARCLDQNVSRVLDALLLDIERHIKRADLARGRIVVHSKGPVWFSLPRPVRGRQRGAL